MESLKPQHALFAEKYLLLGNGTQAALAAGYSEKGAASTAHKLLKRPDLSRYIEQRRVVIASQTDVEISAIVGALKVQVERCMDITRPDLYNPAQANKALELLGRYKAMFTDQISVGVDQADWVERMKADIAKRIEAGELARTAIPSTFAADITAPGERKAMLSNGSAGHANGSAAATQHGEQRPPVGGSREAASD